MLTVAALAGSNLAGLAVFAQPVAAQSAVEASPAPQAPAPTPPVTPSPVAPSPVAPPLVAPPAPPAGASTGGGSAPPLAGTLNAQMEELRRRAAAARAAAAQAAVAAQVADAQAAAAAKAAADSPSAGSVAIAHRVMDAAYAFDSYLHQASGISSNFKKGDEVVNSIMLSAAYEPQQFQEGTVAYAALAALQNPSFVQAVSELSQDPVVRRELIGRLLERPDRALKLPAAPEATATILKCIGPLGDSVLSAGSAVNKASYSVQKETWSKASIVHVDELLTKVKGASAQKAVLAPADAAALIDNIAADCKSGADQPVAAVSPTPTVTRGVALAALAVLGAAGDDSAEQLSTILADEANAQCLKMAKLNLNQCLAVAGPHYEGMFCLGHHGLTETGQCVVTSVGWTGPAPPPAPAPAPPVPAPPQAFMVKLPVAPAETGERDNVMEQGGPPAPAAETAQPTPADHKPASPS